MTETSFLDGMPLPTDSPVVHVSNGRFNVVTNDIKTNLTECILNVELQAAWACLLPIELGITVAGQGWDASLTLDPYPLNRTSFKYGAQRPDLGSRPIELAPSMDQDSKYLGPSLFAWTYYDKLTIGMISFCISDTIPY